MPSYATIISPMVPASVDLFISEQCDVMVVLCAAAVMRDRLWQMF
jgi:hypothetical protein